MLKKALFVAVVSAFVVSCGSTETKPSTTPAADSSATAAPKVDSMKKDTAAPAATPAPAEAKKH